MEQSEQINELAMALAKAQGQIKPAIKDSNNPFFKSSYADLASVWDACREALSNNALCVIQTTDQAEESIVVITTLAHSSGQWIRGKLPIRPVKNDPQSIGSAITYARRYALAAITGVAPEEDDDGEEAMGRKKQSQQKASAPGQSQGTATKPPAQQTTSDPSAELFTVIQNISDVKIRKGENKKTGKPWEKYIITDANKAEYSTFSKSLATIAKQAKEAGIRAELGFTKGEYGNNLETIVLIEGPTDVPYQPENEPWICPEDPILPVSSFVCANCKKNATCEVAKKAVTT